MLTTCAATANGCSPSKPVKLCACKNAPAQGGPQAGWGAPPGGADSDKAILLADTSVSRIPAGVIARSSRGDPGREAHLAHLFIDRNGRALEQFRIEARVDYDGNRVFLVFQSGSAIGAFPLVSPLSGKAEVSLIVRPRFGWAGLGASLGRSGFKVIPQILPLGLLPKTEREIPSWVMLQPSFRASRR